MPDPNAYTARWFATFLDTVPAARTTREVGFLTELLPLPEYRTILDLACGPGRHALLLGRRGYSVTGWDVDAAAIAAGRFAAAADLADVDFVERDIRSLRAADGPFDAVLCLWASFGWFDAAANRALLRAMAEAVRPHGRVLLDVYDAAFFETRAGGERLHARGGIAVRERSRLVEDRLHIDLDYGDGSRDRFHWQIFRAEQLADAAASAGLQLLLACADFDPATPPDGGHPRMQLAFVRE